MVARAAAHSAGIARRGGVPASLSRSGVGAASFMAGAAGEIGAALVVAVVGGTVLYLLWPSLGFLAAPLAAFVAAVACVIALALGVTLLGTAFERIEPEA